MANQDASADRAEMAGRGERRQDDSRNDRQGGEQDGWVDLLNRLPAVWASPEADQTQPAGYGDRLLAAARSVSRGR